MLPTSVLTKNQKINYVSPPHKRYGELAITHVQVRYDDECNNGHNTFSITGHVVATDKRRRDWITGGCIHEEIERAFPELARFIKWHIVSSDGPMHYVNNTVYHAGDRDCWGKRRGEPQWVNWYVRVGDSNALACHPIEDGHILVPKVREFKTEAEAAAYAETIGGTPVRHITMYGEGKERDLDAARRSAIWPDATDEELISPGLEERLLARLPRLMEEFKRDIESLGFTY